MVFRGVDLHIKFVFYEEQNKKIRYANNKIYKLWQKYYSLIYKG